MTIAFQAASAVAVGQTSIPVAYPTVAGGILAGDLLVLACGNHPDTPTVDTPAGWTATATLAGGTGVAAAADVGNSRITTFYQVATGGETGTLTVTLTGAVATASGTGAYGIMLCYRNDTLLWDVASASGVDTTAGTAWSIAYSSNPGLTVNDHLVMASAISTDTAPPVTADTVTATGATIAAPTVVATAATTNGLDLGGRISRTTVTAGTATAAPTHAMTVTTGTNYAGPEALIRIREAPIPTGVLLDLNPGWTTFANGVTSSPTTAAFSPAANSLIIVETHSDGRDTDPEAVTSITDSVGLTWTAIGTTQVGPATTGGFAAAYWAYTASAQTNMTVTANWTAADAKAIKIKTYTNTASTSAVISKAQSTSATNNLTVNVTTTNANCRIAGTAVDWQELGIPTSTDVATGYDITSRVCGMAVHKAFSNATAGTSVPLNFDGAGTNGTSWAYKVWEIAPAATGGPVDLTTNAATQSQVADAPAVSQLQGSPTIDDAIQTQTADAPTLTQFQGTLTVDDAVMLQTAEAPAIIITPVPWVRDARQAGTSGTTTTATHTVPIPTCVVGDDLWASFTLNGGHGTVTDPSGWTRIFPTTITDDGFMTLLIYRKTATSTEAAGGNVTVTVATAVRGDAGSIAIVGSNTALAPEGVVAQTGTSGATSVTTTVTSTADNALIMSILAMDSATENPTPSSPLIQQWDAVEAGITGQGNAGATVHKPTAGDTTVTWTWTNNLVRKAWSASIRSQAAAAANLTVADATEAQVADAPTLTQLHTLTPADATEAQTADSPALAQIHNLTTAAAVQLQTADAPTLSTLSGLTVGDAVQLQTADAPTLTQFQGTLTVDAAVQAQTAASPTLVDPGGSVTISDPVQQQTAGAPTLTQLTVIAVDAAIHVLTSDVAAVGQLQGPLLVSFAAQTQAADAPSLTQVSLVGGSMEPTARAGAAMAATSTQHGPTMAAATRPAPTMTGD